MNLRRIHTSNKQKKDPIKWRGHEVTRIEAFSDAVFGFAITLLIVSLEVPKSFEELIDSLKGFIPFAISFIIFFQIWVAQNQFFRRYGMHDEATLVINACLLFMVLFFVYPMKFLWNTIFMSQVFKLENAHQVAQLYYIYSGGFGIIYLLLTLMYAHAYRRREHIQLTKGEIFETKTYIFRNLGISLVGFLSVIIASTESRASLGLAGMCYILIGPVVGITHARRAKRRKKIHLDEPEVKTVVFSEIKGEEISSEN